MLTWKDVINFSVKGNPKPDRRVEKTEAEWKEILTPEQYRITRLKGTEMAHSGALCSIYDAGQYNCVCCDTPLFDSTIKYDSSSGWPSFTQPIKENAIKYIKDRARYIMFQESSLWVGLYAFQDLAKSYKNDYRLLGETNAGVNWNGKNDLFAANVGNFNNLEEFNAYKLLTGQYDDAYLEDGYDWDWQNNNDNRLKYDRTRNKSEKYNKIKTYLTAGLIINRVISSFDVLSIMKEHNRIISFDVEEDSSNLKLKLNYHF